MQALYIRQCRCLLHRRSRVRSSYVPARAWSNPAPKGTPFRNLIKSQPNNRRGDQYGPLWPAPPSPAPGPSAEALLPAADPRPVRGTLFAGNFALEMRTAEAACSSASRFPYMDRFQVAGVACTSQDIWEALSVQLFPDRLERMQQVAAERCTSILPVVEGLVDRGNVGAVCRSADAMGFGAVHCIETGQTERIKHARGNRTSKGAEKWLDVREHRGTAACVAHLRARGFRVLVTAPRPGAAPVQDVDFTRPTAFLLGNEVDGASEEALALADAAVTLPMATCFVDSLNVSVAAALILAEARRQRVAALGRCGDLTPEEQRVLTAVMLMKQRGPEAVQWHRLWRQHAAESGGKGTSPRAVLGCC